MEIESNSSTGFVARNENVHIMSIIICDREDR